MARLDRIIPGDIAAGDLVMTHLSTNFDRTGFQQDWNLVFPIDRLKELAAEGVIGSVADFHYSFRAAEETDFERYPQKMPCRTGPVAPIGRHPASGPDE